MARWFEVQSHLINFTISTNQISHVTGGVTNHCTSEEYENLKKLSFTTMGSGQLHDDQPNHHYFTPEGRLISTKRLIYVIFIRPAGNKF